MQSMRSELTDLSNVIDGKIRNIKQTSNLSFTRCHWVERDEMGGNGHDSSCPGSNEVVKDVKVFHHNWMDYWYRGTYCCRIGAYLS